MDMRTAEIQSNTVSQSEGLEVIHTAGDKRSYFLPFILDEAELTLPSFLEDLKNGRLKKIYRASVFCDLHHTPSPAWDLIDMKKYASMSIQFSRGCPFNCDFCNVTVLFGHRPRLKSAQQMIAELDRLYDAGWRSDIFQLRDGKRRKNKRLNQTELPVPFQ